MKYFYRVTKPHCTAMHETVVVRFSVFYSSGLFVSLAAVFSWFGVVSFFVLLVRFVLTTPSVVFCLFVILTSWRETVCEP